MHKTTKYDQFTVSSLEKNHALEHTVLSNTNRSIVTERPIFWPFIGFPVGATLIIKLYL